MTTSAYKHPDGIQLFWDIPKLDVPMRADMYIKTKMGRASRSLVHKILSRGEVRIDNHPLPASKLLRGGEKLELWRIKPDDPSDLDDIDVEVIEDHPDFLAINKPAGLAIHPTAKDLYKTLTHWLKVNYPGQPIHPCHRLDRETSGIIICAKNKTTDAALKKAFAAGQVKKTYIAVVRGEWKNPVIPYAKRSTAGGSADSTGPSDLELNSQIAPLSPSDYHLPTLSHKGRGEGSQLLDFPLALQGNRGQVRTKMIHDEGGLPSKTLVQFIRYDAERDQSYLRCYPKTGRQHQIRAHLSLAGYPIVGDKLYAMGEQYFDECCRGVNDPALLDAPRHLLHAEQIEFKLNGTEHKITCHPDFTPKLQPSGTALQPDTLDTLACAHGKCADHAI